MLRRLENFNHDYVYVSPADVIAVEPCDGVRPLSFVCLRDGTKIQVWGRPYEIVEILEKKD